MFLRVRNHKRNKGIRPDFLRITETAVLTVESSQRSVHRQLCAASWEGSWVDLNPTSCCSSSLYVTISCLILLRFTLIGTLPFPSSSFCSYWLVDYVPCLWSRKPHSSLVHSRDQYWALFIILVTNTPRLPKEHGALLYSVGRDRGLWCIDSVAETAVSGA